MKEKRLKQLLSHYQSPKPPADLESRTWARLARRAQARVSAVPDPDTIWTWSMTGAAVAASLTISVGVGYWLGTGLPLMSDFVQLGGGGL